MTFVLNQFGNVVEKYTYDAFGKPTIFDAYGNVLNDANGNPHSAIGNRFLFTGREYIQELSIYDYRHRMYMPGIGRFLQMDPTGFDAGDMNLFRYCDDDPVDGTDPTGLLNMWGNLETFYSGNPSMNVVQDAWNERRFGGLAMAYRSTDSGNATQYKDASHAAMSVKDAVGDKAAKSNDPDSPEAWAPYGQDPNTKMWGTGSVREGNGVDKKFKDRYTEGVTEKVQKSTISRGDLPEKYDFKGFVLGHKFFNAKFVDRDIRRAQDAGKGILLVLPPRPGARDKGYLWKYWEPGHSVISNY